MGLVGEVGCDVVYDGWRIIIERFRSAEGGEQFKVAGGGGGDDGEAGGDGKLEGGETDGGRSAPEEEVFILGGRGGAWVGEVEIVFGVEAVGGGGDGQGEDAALVKGDSRGEEDGGCAGDDGVGLEGAVAGVLGCKTESVCGDTVALLEGRNGGADGFDGASDVAAEDDGELFDKGAVVLHFPVDGIDRPGFVRDQDLVGSRFGGVSLFDAEAGGFGIEPRGFC